MTDLTASRQLKIIEGVFSRCESIIVATDAGREGELIFRWIYDYLGCTKPFMRLWISSLTDEAIRKVWPISGTAATMTVSMRPLNCRAKAGLAGGHERQPSVGDSHKFGQ